MDQSRCSLLLSILVIVYILISSPEVDAHILVYRRLTNQVLLIEEYNDLPAQFGPSLSSTGIKVFAIPVQPDEFGCKEIGQPPSTNYPTNSRFAAIIQRGGDNCTFEKKVRNAQAAHFDAVVVYNNESDDLEHMSAQNASGIMIPSVFVGHSTGMNLRSFFNPELILVINDELPFNINTQLILPFSILIGLCFLIMIFYMIYKCIREERRLRRYRLPKRMLKKLPIVKVTKNSDLGYDTCVICLDNFAEGDKVRILPCRHPYHSACIDVWLTENKRECPICKRKVFTKGEARSQRNRQSSLDSIPDTDDDTTPLLQQSAQSSVNTLNSSNISTSTTTRHGTFRRGGGENNSGAGAGGDVTTDDENMLSSPAQRINPFDRSPNLPPHLAAQLNSGSATRSLWSWPVLRWFRRPTVISVVAPPYQEDILNDVVAGQPPIVDTVSEANNATQTQPMRTTHSSNNVLNPNLSGSFKGAEDDEEDDAPLQCIYEPTAITVVASNSTNSQQLQSHQMMPDSDTSTHNADSDSVFIQTPTQGGIAVAALPHVSNEQAVPPPTRVNNAKFW